MRSTGTCPTTQATARSTFPLLSFLSLTTEASGGRPHADAGAEHRAAVPERRAGVHSAESADGGSERAVRRRVGAGAERVGGLGGRDVGGA